MRQYITISMSLSGGQAELTPQSQEIINQMAQRASLLDYDLLSDIHYIFEKAFKDMEIQYHKNWDAWLDDRIKKIDQQIANEGKQDAS